GEEYDALIISIQKFGCFVELFEVFVKGFFPSMPWKNSQAPVASIANAITPWSPYQVRKAAGAGLASDLAEAPRPNRWNGISATAFVSAPNASIPCENGSNSRWSAEIKEEFLISANRRDRNVKRLVIFYASGAATASDCISDAPANSAILKCPVATEPPGLRGKIPEQRGFNPRDAIHVFPASH